MGTVDTYPRSVILLGYGDEPFLEEALAAIEADCGPLDEIILVDNGIEGRSAREGAWPARVRIVGDGENTGFSGGCVRGAAAAMGDAFVFVNSDAIVRRGTFDALTRGLGQPGVGIACGCLRLAGQPDLVNSVGNPLHFSGISWAGACGEPAVDHLVERDVAVATGGLLALSRTAWDALDGFDELYFAYHEDTDLSLRAWLLGMCVRYVPDAVADHHYEFGRSPIKMYLVERNRLITVLTDYPARLLRAVLPALVGMELLILLQSVLQGWATQKLKSWWWLARHARLLRARRTKVQSEVTASDADIAALLVARIEPPMMAPPPGMGLVNRVLQAYWSLARRSLVTRGQ